MFSPSWIHCSSADDVGKEAASQVAQLLLEKPQASIVFPTGKTPTPMYQQISAQMDLNWSQSRLFQLDEYCPSQRAPSFGEWLDQALWQSIQGAQKFYMRDYYRSVEGWTLYEELLAENEGPDLIILGIGMNGHIAFNEPGSSRDSRMRQVALTTQTLKDNFGLHDKEEARQQGYPTDAVTLGIGDILLARKILLLATGARKQSIMQHAFSPDHPPSNDCPASWLKEHPQVMVLADFPFI